MFVKLLRSVAIGLIVGAILLVAMPSLRSLNPLSTPQFDSTDETPASYNLAVRRAAPAVVNVYNRGLNTNSHNQLEIRTLGSGVIMDQRGYIITNKHVINDADQIIVALQDGRVFEALLVGSDSLTDLAVLKINATGGLPTIPINPRRVPHIGDVVLAIGSRLSDFTTGSKRLFGREDVRFLTINNCRFHAYKMDAVKAVGDAKATLEALAEKLRGRGYVSAYKGE